MRFFRNCKIQTKLMLCFGALVACVVIGFGLCVRNVNLMTKSTDEVSKKWLPASNCLNDARNELATFRRVTFNHTLNTEEAKMREAEQLLATSRTNYDTKLAQWKVLSTSPEAIALAIKIEDVAGSFFSESEKALVFSRVNKFEEAKANLEKETAEMRMRLMKTLEDRGKQEQFNFLTALLPVLDNLNLAVAASETDASIDNLRSGVIGTARSFERALIDVGVEPITSVGGTFDPEQHEAVDIVPTEEENDGNITAEYARGYRFGGKLLRPARVQVGKGIADLAAE